MNRKIAWLVMLWCVTAGYQSLAGQQGRGGRGGDPEAGANATRPPLLFTETWKEPQAARPLPIEERLVSKVQVVGNPDLELKFYGPDAKTVSVNPHEGRLDLWNGDTSSPVAITLRHKSSYFDLTGLARLRWIVRTQGLHAAHPVLKLADGTLIAGSHRDDTDGIFLQSEIAFTNQRWYRLDPMKMVTTVIVPNPDLSKVDEIGWVDLAPGGGRGVAGWVNMSTIELYAKAVPR
jgi:hypothetical protein